MDAAVRAYLDTIPSPRRRRDAETMIGLLGRAPGAEPQMWGSIVGYGHYHYKYASGREGDPGAAGFSARKAATTIYVAIYVADGVGAYAELLERLGPHTTGVGCIYVKVPCTHEALPPRGGAGPLRHLGRSTGRRRHDERGS